MPAEVTRVRHASHCGLVPQPLHVGQHQSCGTGVGAGCPDLLLSPGWFQEDHDPAALGAFRPHQTLVLWPHTQGGLSHPH